MQLDIQDVEEGTCACGLAAIKFIAGQPFCAHCSDEKLIKFIYKAIEHLQGVIITTKLYTPEVFREVFGENRLESTSNHRIITPLKHYQPFSEEVSELVRNMRQLAFDSQHDRITEGHLQLLILNTKPAKNILSYSKQKRLRQAAIKLLPSAVPDECPPSAKLLPFTVETKEVFEKAAVIAQRDDAKTITLEHLVKALYVENDNPVDYVNT
jgi:hypothetical protein